MRKDSFSQEELRKLDLNDRYVRAMVYVKEKGRITNKEYRGMFDITDRMALIDLSDICAKNIFERIDKTGRNIEYVLSRNKPEKPEIDKNISIYHILRRMRQTSQPQKITPPFSAHTR